MSLILMHVPLLQLNVSYPATGCQKLFEFDDEKKVRVFNERRMGQEVEADTLGEEWKGYVLRIAGGNDKQGFPMKQGVLTNSKFIDQPVYQHSELGNFLVSDTRETAV